MRVQMFSSDEGLPWIIDFDKLETFVDAINLRGWDGLDFLCYLRERYSLHGKIWTTDELDYAADFIHDGCLDSISCVPYTIIYADRGPAVLFDEIEYIRRGGRGDIAFPRCERPSHRKRADV
jgi:hypothetical protein